MSRIVTCYVLQHIVLQQAQRQFKMKNGIYISCFFKTFQFDKFFVCHIRHCAFKKNVKYRFTFIRTI